MADQCRICSKVVRKKKKECSADIISVIVPERSSYQSELKTNLNESITCGLGQGPENHFFQRAIKYLPPFFSPHIVEVGGFTWGLCCFSPVSPLVLSRKLRDGFTHRGALINTWCCYAACAGLSHICAMTKHSLFFKSRTDVSSYNCFIIDMSCPAKFWMTH